MEESKCHLDYRLAFVEFVKDFFGECSFVGENQEVLRVAPEGLPQCWITCGVGGTHSGKEGAFELMFSTSEAFEAACGTGVCTELWQLGQRLALEKDPLSVLKLSEGMEGFGYTHVLPWPVGQWERKGEADVAVFVLIPLYKEETEWIEAHSVREFVLAYHTQVSEEAFFHLDVKRNPVDPDSFGTDVTCAWEQ